MAGLCGRVSQRYSAGPGNGIGCFRVTLTEGERKKNVIVILQAYFRSILDREGKGDRYKSFFYGHGAWGSSGRLRIYQELVRQKMLTAEEQALFREIISESLKSSFDYSMSERSANNRPYGVNGGTAIALQMFPDLSQAKSHRRWLDAHGWSSSNTEIPLRPTTIPTAQSIWTGSSIWRREWGNSKRSASSFMPTSVAILTTCTAAEYGAIQLWLACRS